MARLRLFPDIILWGCMACLCLSCDKACVAEQQIAVPHAVWHKDTIVPVTLPVADTLSEHHILLTFRHNEDYPYNNIILSVTVQAPTVAAFCDTVEYRLTDAQAEWAGRKSGKWRDNRMAFRSRVQFPQSGDYTFRIAHLMRNEQLKGVGAVGVRIETSLNEH